jgi:hypothetical protein
VLKLFVGFNSLRDSSEQKLGYNVKYKGNKIYKDQAVITNTIFWIRYILV